MSYATKLHGRETVVTVVAHANQRLMSPYSCGNLLAARRLGSYDALVWRVSIQGDCGGGSWRV